MPWSSPEAFFAMGGYGLYGWGSYAMMALLMGLEGWMAVQRHRQARDKALSGVAQEHSQ